MKAQTDAIIKCPKCKAFIDKGVTTNVTDSSGCLIIVRNVPCYKCSECDETLYTTDVIKRLERIIASVQKLMQEIAVIDYARTD
ncbi:type II toxin-antitoxin system MqsA family antitoxin [Acutalibacter sp. JLR.KK004]|uniref:type II toxin-antitoxin system MqsA family antitoxin n=1 Tax=Acutalibacter sp. JLR.KK004 TaxID=3112622 RepID=UPI002FEFD4B0